MGIIDRAIATFSPGWAAQRAAARLKLNAYESALPNRLHKARRESRSADNAVFAAGVSLREQARWLDENHDIVIGILDKLEERVVGARGIQIEPHPLDRAGNVHTEFAELLANRWAEWSLRPEVTGMFTRPEMERLILRSALRDGEVFGQLVMGPVAGLQHASREQFSVEMLEADFVPMTLSGTTAEQGIELNAWGRPVAYSVYKRHPGAGLNFTMSTKKINADRMIHLAFRRRLHQVRGVSIMHGVIKRLSDIKEYEDAERVMARVSACLGFYIKRAMPDDYTVDDVADPADSERRLFDFSPGMVFDELGPGEDIGVLESNRPDAHITDFRNGQLRAVAAGTRSGYSSVARDYNGTYSSQRQELVESFEGFNVLQDWFVGQYARPVYRSWLKMLLLSDIRIPDDLDRRTLFNAIYLGPVMPWIDPVKEANAWKAIVRGGAGSEAEWARARGQSPAEVKRQRIRETQFNRENNLVFDSDAANDSGVTYDVPQKKTRQDPAPGDD